MKRDNTKVVDFINGLSESEMEEALLLLRRNIEIKYKSKLTIWGLKQRDLAKKYKVDNQLIYKAVNGFNDDPSLQMRRKIKKDLEVGE